MRLVTPIASQAAVEAGLASPEVAPDRSGVWGGITARASWRVLAGCLSEGRRSGGLPADNRRDLGAQELNRAHDLGVRHRPHAHLGEKSLMPEQPVLKKDLVDDFLRA